MAGIKRAQTETAQPHERIAIVADTPRLRDIRQRALIHVSFE